MTDRIFFRSVPVRSFWNFHLSPIVHQMPAAIVLPDPPPDTFQTFQCCISKRSCIADQPVSLMPCSEKFRCKSDIGIILDAVKNLITSDHQQIQLRSIIICLFQSQYRIILSGIILLYFTNWILSLNLPFIRRISRPFCIFLFSFRWFLLTEGYILQDDSQQILLLHHTLPSSFSMHMPAGTNHNYRFSAWKGFLLFHLLFPSNSLSTIASNFSLNR